MEAYKELLGVILEVQTKSKQEKRMKKFIRSYLTEIGLKTSHDDMGNIYCHKGDKRKHRPFVVAHMDTVHDINNDVVVYELDGVLIAWDAKTCRQYGIGGDDKVGVWAALAAITKFDNISVAFMVQEETGCIGSGGANLNEFKNVNWMAQLDRRDNDDFIISDFASKEFIGDMGKLAVARGMTIQDQSTITDVNRLWRRGINASCVNISSGYYYPHTSSEVVVIDDAMNSLELLFEMIKSHGDKKYAHKHIPYVPPKKNNKGRSMSARDRRDSEIGFDYSRRKRAMMTGVIVGDRLRVFNNTFKCFEWWTRDGETFLYYEGENITLKDGKISYDGQTTIPLGSASSNNEKDDFDTIDDFLNRADQIDMERSMEKANRDVKSIKRYHDYEESRDTYSDDALDNYNAIAARSKIDGVLVLYGYTFKDFIQGEIPDVIIMNMSASLYYDTGNPLCYFCNEMGIDDTYISADYTGEFTDFSAVDLNGDKPCPF